MKNETIINEYEGIFILNPNINLKEFDRTIKSLQKEIKSKIEYTSKCIKVATHSTIKNEEYLGVKKLAYEIQKQQYGYYIIFNFSIGGTKQKIQETITNIERQARIDSNIIKFIVIKKD